MGSQKYGRIKVVERLGDNLISALSNKAPWRSEACGRPNCMPCRSKAGSCKARNITYSISCNLCTKEGEKAVYWGESHRTWWDRAENHRVALDTGDLDYAVVKHMVNKHQGAQWDYKFDLHKSWKTSLERQIMEAIKISETPPDDLMNSKSEWGNNSVPRVVVEQDRDRDKNGTKRAVLNRDMDPGDRPKRKRPNTETQNSKWNRKTSDDLKSTFKSIGSYFVSNSQNSPSVSGMEPSSK